MNAINRGRTPQGARTKTVRPNGAAAPMAERIAGVELLLLRFAVFLVFLMELFRFLYHEIRSIVTF